MKKTNSYLARILTIVLFGMLAVSCSSSLSVTKRVHRKGYHVSYNSSNIKLEQIKSLVAVDEINIAERDLKNYSTDFEQEEIFLLKSDNLSSNRFSNNEGLSRKQINFPVNLKKGDLLDQSHFNPDPKEKKRKRAKQNETAMYVILGLLAVGLFLIIIIVSALNDTRDAVRDLQSPI